MSLELILENWSDYDDKKIRDKRDSKDFACTESWERDYLKDKIKKLYPQLTEEKIIDAIDNCCETLNAPYPREEFVKCVIARLGI